MKRCWMALAVLAVLAMLGNAGAQDFPTREIRLIVGVTPGSAADIIARAFTPAMAERLKQPVVIDNRPGADTIIATNVVRSAKPDGYTLLLAQPAHAINPTLYPDRAYDPVKDFTPIALVSTSSNVFVVRADSPIKDLAGLIAAAKAKPDALNYGDAGGSPYLAAEMLNTTAGVRTTHVAYKGAAEALTEVLGGRLDYAPTSVSSATALLRAGQLRALAVTTSTRNPDFPDVPTVAELLPGYQAITWWGVVGPAGMPPAVTARLNEAIAGAIRDPAVKARLAAVGIDAVTGTPDEFSAFIVSEMQKWAPIVKATMAARRGS
jgi:tripartite-type tricarboxylate transporter receptor subunit TctC